MTLYEELVNESGYLYSKYYAYYATGRTPYELSRLKRKHEEAISLAKRKIKEADTIIVGGASGLSAAGGGDFYYSASDSFKKYFGKYYKKYHFHGAFEGMQYPFKDPAERWGYLITFLHTTINAPIRTPYLELDKLLKGKEFFVLTTNQDTQFVKLYPESKVAQIEGDHRYFQCKNSCHDAVYPAVETINRLFDEMGDSLSIPQDEIPRCPVCHEEMFPWVRGYGNFLEGKRYHEEYRKAGEYIAQHMKGKVLYLELGVGRLTPMFIQEPFWNLTAMNPDAFYLSVNKDYAYMPKQIEERGLVIKDDILTVLKELNQKN